jgi:hypothetical protein
VQKPGGKAGKQQQGASAATSGADHRFAFFRHPPGTAPFEELPSRLRAEYEALARTGLENLARVFG